MANDDGAKSYDDQGVDLTLVRYTLGLTPTERLKAVEQFMNAMATVKRTSSRSESKDRSHTDEPIAGDD